MGKSSSGQLPQITIGYQSGHLTVVAATPKRKAGYVLWKCQCLCGNEVLLDTRSLQRGAVQSCGCLSKFRPGQRDLTGQRFGRLVCLAPSSQRSKDGCIVWKCRCDCGRECTAASKQLTQGYKKSCGCLGHPPKKDFIGHRFGQLTVTGYAGKRNGMHRWSCLCDCGRETTVGQTLLQTGKTKSCGCLQAKSITENLKLCEGTSIALLEASQRRLIRSNSSGYTGVYMDKRTGRWVAQITFQKKTYYLGSYAHLEDAVKARRRGEEKHTDFLEWYYAQHPNASPK